MSKQYWASACSAAISTPVRLSSNSWGAVVVRCSAARALHYNISDPMLHRRCFIWFSFPFRLLLSSFALLRAAGCSGIGGDWMLLLEIASGSTTDGSADSCAPAAAWEHCLTWLGRSFSPHGTTQITTKLQSVAAACNTLKPWPRMLL
jgi:hypothetical protein